MTYKLTKIQQVLDRKWESARPTLDHVVINIDKEHKKIKDELTPAAIGSPTYNDYQDVLNTQNSSGIISGGTVTSDGDGTITVAAGTGVIKSSASSTGIQLFFDWNADTSLTPDDDTTSYISMDYNDGTPQARTDTTDPSNGETIFNIATVFRESTVVYVGETGTKVPELLKRVHKHHSEVKLVDIVSGGLLSETGTRYLAMTEAGVWLGINKETFGAIDTTGADTFDLYYNDGAWQESSVSQLGNTQYNDYGTGLADLTTNRYGLYWVYLDLSGKLLVVYGTVNYVLLSAAQDEKPPSNLPNHVSEFSAITGKIIFKKGETNFTEVINANIEQFTPSAATDHEGLVNLLGGASNDHYHFTGTQHTLLTGFTDDANEQVANLATDDSPTFVGLTLTGTLGVAGVTTLNSGSADVDTVINGDGLVAYKYDAGNIQHGFGRAPTQTFDFYKASAAINFNVETSDGSQVTLHLNNTSSDWQIINATGDFQIYNGNGSKEIMLADHACTKRAFDIYDANIIFNAERADHDFIIYGKTAGNAFHYDFDNDIINIGRNIATAEEIALLDDKKINFGTDGDGYLQYNSSYDAMHLDADKEIFLKAGENVHAWLGDNAGAHSFTVMDLAENDVFSVNSNGDTDITTKITLGATAKLCSLASPFYCIDIQGGSAQYSSIRLHSTVSTTDSDYPLLIFLKGAGSSPVTGDITHIDFKAYNSVPSATVFVKFVADSLDATDGSEDAAYYFRTMKGGVLANRYYYTSTTDIHTFSGGMTDVDVYSDTVGGTNRDLYIDDTGIIGYVSSSKRYKKNIKNLIDYNSVYKLRPVTFDYKISGKNQVGLIAEEVEKYIPGLVSYNDNGQPETVQYSRLCIYLLCAIKNLKERLDRRLS